MATILTVHKSNSNLIYQLRWKMCIFFVATIHFLLLMFVVCKLMPSAHGRIKGAPRKSRSECPIFIGVSQRTRTNFIADITTDLPYNFYRSVIWRTRSDFLSKLLCVTMAGEVPLLVYVSAHGPIFTQTKNQSMCARH